MKELYAYVIAALTLTAVILYSCTARDKRIATNLYKERESLLQEFKGKSIMNRSKAFYQLSYYKGQFVNTFSFEKKDDSLILTNNTLQYPITEITAFATIKVSDSSSYRKSLTDELSRLLKVMNDFKIKNVSAEFAPVGLDMKIYFGDYKAMLYIGNIHAVKNERWIKYIKSGEKFDENWYSVTDEL
jgi:hypothetical protein